jgi:hypothetical protein
MFSTYIIVAVECMERAQRISCWPVVVHCIDGQGYINGRDRNCNLVGAVFVGIKQADVHICCRFYVLGQCFPQNDACRAVFIKMYEEQLDSGPVGQILQQQ